VRFEVSRVLDAIERRLTTDPAIARAVVDLADVVRFADLDGGRAGNLLRLGLVVDALGRHLGEDNVSVYAVVDRALLSDADLTSNERMVIRRWADDGLVEVLPAPGDRVLEVADLTGLPVLSRQAYEPARDGYAWRAGEPGRLLTPMPGHGGAVVSARVPGTPARAAAPTRSPMLARLWRCPDPDCASFGPARSERAGGQPPPHVRGGVPYCPRHGERLADAGPRPPAHVLAVRVDGVVRQRFVVTGERPVVVGRAPDGAREGPGTVMVGPWLSEEARRWISRSHVRLELRGAELTARDVSTNGTVVRPGGSMHESARVMLSRDQSRALAADDVLELYPGVHVGPPWSLSSTGAATSSVMGDAPTMSLRLPR
jgi:hypothetical protein